MCEFLAQGNYAIARHHCDLNLQPRKVPDVSILQTGSPCVFSSSDSRRNSLHYRPYLVQQWFYWLSFRHMFASRVTPIHFGCQGFVVSHTFLILHLLSVLLAQLYSSVIIGLGVVVKLSEQSALSTSGSGGFVSFDSYLLQFHVCTLHHSLFYPL